MTGSIRIKAFAEALQRRRRATRPRTRRLARVFLLLRRPLLMQRFTQQHFHARISAAARISAQRIVAVRPTLVSVRTERQVQPSADLAERAIVRCAVHEVQRSVVVQRILARGARPPNVANAVQKTRLESERPAPVPRIVRMPAALKEIPASGRPAEALSLSADWGQPIQPVLPVSHAELSADQINRLTERVMTSIDRRLLAYRERTGRI